jgi:hypothetical protein
MNRANRRRIATCLYSMAVDRLDASLADMAAATEIHSVRVDARRARSMCHSMSIDGRLNQSPAVTDCEELPRTRSSSHLR